MATFKQWGKLDMPVKQGSKGTKVVVPKGKGMIQKSVFHVSQTSKPNWEPLKPENQLVNELTAQFESSLNISDKSMLDQRFVFEKMVEYVQEYQFVSFSNWLQKHSNCGNISSEKLKEILTQMSKTDNISYVPEKVSSDCTK